jgi:Domain of unknown function (DUF4157)
LERQRIGTRMFAPPSHNPAKKSAEGKAKSADVAAGPKDPRRPNPVWQSLAMRSGVVQAKLTIGQADDPYEREADRVADQVMRIPAPQSNGHGLSITPVTAHQAQRKCAECEEEEEEEGALQRKESGSTEAPAAAPPMVYETLSSPGRPLDTNTRTFFESRLGSDFSEVLVHDDARAAESAGAMNALAFTVNRHVFFGSGQYSPGTERGNRLLAHELAHVLQQKGQRNIADTGSAVRTQAQPDTLMRQGTDVEDLDSDEFLQERQPNFTGVVVGSWGQSFPAQLVGGERLDTSFPEADHRRAIDFAMDLREPCVIMREYHRLWIYGLKWEGLSAHFSRFTNASTILFLASPEEEGGGVYSVSNVTGHRDVEAFVTEDGGVLLPPGAGQLFLHTGGEFEETMVSAAQNAGAFLGGLMKGLSDADFAGLAKRLQSMAGLNAVFPLPFTIGALHGVGNELIDFARMFDPRQWKAMEAAAQETILMLSDPDGEELAALLGEEVGRTQAASLDQLLNKSLVTFAYEVGKLIGPIIVETLLAFLGIEVGPLALIEKAVDLVKKAPRLTGVLGRMAAEFADVTDLPRLPRPDGNTLHPPHVDIGVPGETQRVIPDSESAGGGRHTEELAPPVEDTPSGHPPRSESTAIIRRPPPMVTLPGGHTLKYDGKRLWICSWPCDEFRLRYRRELDADPNLRAEVDRIEQDMDAAETAGDWATRDRHFDEAILLGARLQLTHFEHLALDLEDGVRKPAEAAAALLLENRIGRSLERLDPNSRTIRHFGKTGDFWDPIAQRSYDHTGGDARLGPGDVLGDVYSHLQKVGVDVVLVDVSGMQAADVAEIIAGIQRQWPDEFAQGAVGSMTGGRGIVIVP